MPDNQEDGIPVVPLVLHYECCEVPENVERNIRNTLSRDYKPFSLLLSDWHEREVSICGFGPSLRDEVQNISGDVLACNGAHNWLIDQGIIPKFGMFWDAAGVVSQFVRPHKDVTYLVASRCHQSVFDALEGFDVYVWHAKGDQCLEDLLVEFNRMEPMLHGGSAAVTRAMEVVTTMGYRKTKLFGADSSYTTTTHVNDSLVQERHLRVKCYGEWFDTTPWLAGQANDFRTIAPVQKLRGIDLSVYGHGLLPHLAKVMGFEVFTSRDATSSRT
jgi:hypothetical protein